MSDGSNIDVAMYREEMGEFPSLRYPADRHLHMLNWLTRLSRDAGCQPPILVGCGAVELFTDAQTATGDVDIIAPDAVKLGSTLVSLGFQRSSDHRFWFHPAHSVLFEFPSDKLRPGERTVTLDLDGIECFIISPEDLIVDRLEAYEASGSGTDLVYAYLVYHGLYDQLDHDRLNGSVESADLKRIHSFLSELHDKAANKGLSVDEQGAQLTKEIRSGRSG